MNQKPFYIDSFRDLLKRYDTEEISLSKLVEELNETAYKWAAPTPPSLGQQVGEMAGDEMPDELNKQVVEVIKKHIPNDGSIEQVTRCGLINYVVSLCYKTIKDYVLADWQQKQLAPVDGVGLIAKERQEQIEKHGRTIQRDVEENDNEQLSMGAYMLLSVDFEEGIDPESFPDGWDKDICSHMISKPYKERLIIVGALIAAEIDRIQSKINKV